MPLSSCSTSGQFNSTCPSALPPHAEAAAASPSFTKALGDELKASGLSLPDCAAPMPLDKELGITDASAHVSSAVGLMGWWAGDSELPGQGAIACYHVFMPGCSWAAVHVRQARVARAHPCMAVR